MITGQLRQKTSRSRVGISWLFDQLDLELFAKSGDLAKPPQRKPS